MPEPIRTNRRENQAKGAAVGAGAGALAMPTRVFSNAKKNPYKDMETGNHSVDMHTVHENAARTGRRFQNKSYTAGLAQHLKDSPDKGTLHMVVSSDGHATQVDGAHRTWANTLNGEPRMNVRVDHVKGQRPTRSFVGNVEAAYRDAKHRRQLKSDYDAPHRTKLVEDRARNLHPSTRAKNDVISGMRDTKAKISGGEKFDPLTAKIGMSAGKLRTKQAAFVAGGAAAGAGAVALGQRAAGKVQVKVKKSNTTSAFGVDHGSLQ